MLLVADLSSFLLSTYELVDEIHKMLNIDAIEHSTETGSVDNYSFHHQETYNWQAKRNFRWEWDGKINGGSNVST